MIRHQNFCASGTFCPKCPHFYMKRKEDLDYHRDKHCAPEDKKLSAV